MLTVLSCTVSKELKGSAARNMSLQSSTQHQTTEETTGMPYISKPEIDVQPLDARRPQASCGTKSEAPDF